MLRPRPLTPPRIPFFARLRIGRKLMLLVLLPVTTMLVFTLVGGVSQWREARALGEFRSATQVSFATTALTDAVARERIAAVQARLRPGSTTLRERSAAQRATETALHRTLEGSGSWTGQPDVPGRLDAADRKLHALRIQTRTGSLTAPQLAGQYDTIEHDLLSTVATLESGRPTRESGRAADAHLALLDAIEAAERERVELAVLFHAPPARTTATNRWSALEQSRLDAFQQTASDALKSRLYATLLENPGLVVRKTRDTLADPDARRNWPSYDRWTAASTARIDALRGIQERAAAELGRTAVDDLDAAEQREIRDLAVSLGVLAAVTALALTLRRSITRPLSEVSAGARALSEGDLSYDIRYAGRDELGDVADTFRELRVTTERLAAEIHAMNEAIDDNRLQHRTDVGAFQGTWARLLGGMDGTMASFAAAHGRRHQAEQELASIFHLSLDLLCIAGLDGFFKRVNPAFERTLGHTTEALLATPWLEFVHPHDRARTRAALERLADGVELAEFENRLLRPDGTERWLQWSARPVTDEGLIYAAARDVTESRRTAREQAALRRVATLVARSAPPQQVFSEVADQVGTVLGSGSVAVLRYAADGTATVIGTARGPAAEGEAVAAEVAATRRPARVERAVGAPIVVDGRLWGAVVAAAAGLEPPPPGTESRLADFTELAATALANADSRAQLTASRARVVAAGDASRRRIERDLHDGVQQRLVSLQLDLRTAQSMLEEQPDALPEQLDHIVKGLDDAFTDLLQVARGIHPVILSKGGLGPALRALARRSSVPVELDLRLPPDRLAEQTEVAVYYVTSECLTNAAKHARASLVQVTARTYDDALEVTIVDDGTGGAEPGRGSGLIGLIDRVEAIGGRLTVSSPSGQGTTLTVRLPLNGAERDT
ncbi:nitrate- and nitrite sensing domain-containing protein [Streptomyces sp. GESEQ-35]|uniref:nitrate- and nitrite sensing domain-containing protein n=1 Tax=Streptomyces sp. GESEQ-35 TaxID=2812657 RepID=UPI001B336103|nr:nitrate- and nitrite sensing domain-containing protein [Streptomyces sp. GESEQ-35]